MAEEQKTSRSGKTLDFTAIQQQVLACAEKNPRVQVGQSTVDLARRLVRKNPGVETAPTVDLNGQGQQSASTVNLDSQSPTVEANSQGQQSRSAVQQSSPTVIPPSQHAPVDSELKRLFPEPHPLQKLLNCTSKKQIFEYLKNHGSHITKNEIVAEVTGVPEGTVRDVLRAFEAAGVIKKERWREGVQRGMKITLLTDLTVNLNSQTRQSRSTVDIPPLEVKREKENLFKPGPGTTQERTIVQKLRSLTKEQIEDFYPGLASIGFTSVQVSQILDSLESIDRSPDNLFRALEHADFAVENDLLFRKGGVKITEPQEQLTYIVGGLRKSGYWAPPKGYVPPEVQAQRDAAERDRMLLAAKNEAEEAAFHLWRAQLPEVEKTSLRQAAESRGRNKGFLGPEEIWLKEAWREMNSR